MDKDLESMISLEAEMLLGSAFKIVNEHGVCYMRFTKEDGIVIIKPEYNKRINGVIADA